MVLDALLRFWGFSPIITLVTIFDFFPVENSTIHYSVLKQKISCIFKVQRALSKRPPVPTHTHAPEPAEY